MKVVVVGGAGFIGSSVVRALLDERETVMVIDDLSTGSAENVHPWSSFRKMDVFDDALGEVMGEFEPDAVISLAGQANVAFSVTHPEKDWNQNVEGTRRVVASARDAGAKRVLLASSAAVYGEATDNPLDETHPCDPVSPHGRSMLAAEFVLREELEGTDIDYAALRISNTYGPRQSDSMYSNVVSHFCHALSKEESPVVYGDGSQSRDFIYVADVVHAFSSALAHEGRLASADGFAYNISTGVATPVEHVLLALRASSFFMDPATYEPVREGDVTKSYCDPQRALDTFGWIHYVPVERGLDMTWRWHSREH